MPDALEQLALETMDEILRELSVEERLKGLSLGEALKDLPTEDRVKGLAAEDRLKGLSLDDFLAELSPETRAALMQRLKEKLDFELANLDEIFANRR